MRALEDEAAERVGVGPPRVAADDALEGGLVARLARELAEPGMVVARGRRDEVHRRTEALLEDALGLDDLAAKLVVVERRGARVRERVGADLHARSDHVGELGPRHRVAVADAAGGDEEDGALGALGERGGREGGVAAVAVVEGEDDGPLGQLALAAMPADEVAHRHRREALGGEVVEVLAQLVEGEDVEPGAGVPGIEVLGPLDDRVPGEHRDRVNGGG